MPMYESSHKHVYQEIVWTGQNVLPHKGLLLSHCPVMAYPVVGRQVPP